MSVVLAVIALTCCFLVAGPRELPARELAGQSREVAGKLSETDTPGNALGLDVSRLGEDQGRATGVSETVRVAPGSDADRNTGVSAMAKWHFARTPGASAYLGAGGGGIQSRDGSSQGGMGQAGIGGSMDLSDKVSLKMDGRYQTRGAFDDKSGGNVGGSVGLKISF